METWEFYFMMGTGIYLTLLGGLMYKGHKKYASSAVGIYNIIMGILSIIAGIIGKNIGTIGEKIFFSFMVLLMVSFIGFSILNLLTKKR
ncbi:hypothetical protein CLHOM_25940 [Clostridium homopropionicum DSM 5847]|uniref:Uncharacterized protein n=1 Tax=Clostridium homopropionicum DSM 5847 TaxID=1121318 RepID=A0A0L6Z7S6_9CLOT|nr:hypothetical protein [Clostridium homopropionicum]KOA19021.1 hypothetical protein CLHOM_25940 [Clostridium homopropionicum DSM 5847]SFH00696.1 hypothetical protein SAMN04488501_1348 [Clostridium homopropionicum]